LHEEEPTVYPPWADIFSFSLLHEIGHLLLYDKRHVFIEDGDRDRAQETEADRFAAESLVPQAEYDDLLAGDRMDTSSIAAFARRMGIHAGIVVGRLEHNGLLPRSFHDLREKYEWAA